MLVQESERSSSSASSHFKVRPPENILERERLVDSDDEDDSLWKLSKALAALEKHAGSKTPTLPGLVV